jgi:voltage-gated potassium channel Kch
MLKSILVGILLAIATIVVHAVGTSNWIDFLRRNEKRFRSRLGEIKVLTCTAIVLLLLHTFEVLLWATTYYLISDSQQFTSFEDAAYFSTVTFTSLGYGDIVLVGAWRMLSAFQAMTGLLVFGWSTALLFTIVQRIWQHKYDA